jgi:hypothetical protein
MVATMEQLYLADKKMAAPPLEKHSSVCQVAAYHPLAVSLFVVAVD